MTPIITKRNAPAPNIAGGAPLVFTRDLQPATTPGTQARAADDNLGRLRKLVPAEVIAGYTALLAITSSVVHESVRYAVPVAVVLCIALVVLALRRAGREHTPPVAPPRLQYIFATLAFTTWAITIRDPLDPFGYEIPGWITAFGCVLIPLFGSYLIDFTDKEPDAGS